MTTTGERTTVQNADGMDDDIFKRHFEMRHGDSLGGLTHFSPDITAQVLQMYRSFHKRLHEIRLELHHDHER